MNGGNTIQVNGKTFHVIQAPLQSNPGIHNGNFTAITSVNTPQRTLPPGLHGGVFTPVTGPASGGQPGLHNGVYTPIPPPHHKGGVYGDEVDEALNKKDVKDEKPAKSNGVEKAILVFMIILIIMLFIPCCMFSSSCVTCSSLASGCGSIDAACTTSSETIYDNLTSCSQKIEDRVGNRRERVQHWVGEIVGPIEDWANKIDGWIGEIPSWNSTVKNWSKKASHWADLLDGGGGSW